MIQRVTVVRLYIEIFLAAAVGSAELFIMHLADTYPSCGRYEFIYPLLVGLLLGIFGRAPVWIIGPATMLSMPVGMVVDMFTGGHGLNLWPIALMFYGVLSLIGLTGTAIGRWAKRWWIKQNLKEAGK